MEDSFLAKLEHSYKNKNIPVWIKNNLKYFFLSYTKNLKKQQETTITNDQLFVQYLSFIEQQLSSPFLFGAYHEKITSPTDYYTFGMNFFRPFIIKEESYILGEEHLKTIHQQLKKKENVILFANHQIEADPQALNILLEDSCPETAKDIIFVAGHRVTSDPLAVPFSLGRNLLCIYSKNYMDLEPEKKREKIRHNQQSMKELVRLLSEGGKWIYVAPSGGRDRLGDSREVEIAPFDPQSVHMFLLMAKQAKTPSHFYPLALDTYHILPPPKFRQDQLGEDRPLSRSTIHAAFGEEIKLDHFSNHKFSTKKEFYQFQAKNIENLVLDNYNEIKKLSSL